MFTWDTQKAIINFEKHRVSFEEASTVFFDPNAFETDDLKHSDQEKRFMRLGISISKRVLLVIYTMRSSKYEKEKIRIISARQASSKERAVYSRQRD
jgi:uncharacterized DUF497 family protein